MAALCFSWRGAGYAKRQPRRSHGGSLMAGTHWVILVGFSALSACSLPPIGSGGNQDSQFITEEEVAASPGTTALEVIHNLRPNFLSYRGETSFDKRSSR